jgi:hypothetical protein
VSRLWDKTASCGEVEVGFGFGGRRRTRGTAVYVWEVSYAWDALLSSVVKACFMARQARGPLSPCIACIQ